MKVAVDDSNDRAMTEIRIGEMCRYDVCDYDSLEGSSIQYRLNRCLSATLSCNTDEQ